MLHTEWSPGNVVVNDVAHVVDWAWPTRGAGWIDPACWIVWLMASGHSCPSAENWAAQVPPWHTAPRDCLDEFARAQASMWQEIAHDDPQPWTHRMADAARRWAEHRSARATRIRDPKRTTPSGHGGFVEYHRGYAWLKMPLQDGQKILNTLLNTAFHDRVTIRWQSGSWRMHVPFRYEKNSGIGLADAAQIYFPREQIAELTIILNGSVG